MDIPKYDPEQARLKEIQKAEQEWRDKLDRAEQRAIEEERKKEWDERVASIMAKLNTGK